MTKWRTRIALVFSTIALVFLAGSPAQAITVWMSATNGAATGGFQNVGDHVYVIDKAADGMSAVTYWETDYGRSGHCRDGNGANNGTTTCNEDLWEEGFVRVMSCVRDYGLPYSLPQYCSGWSGWHPIKGFVV